VDETRASTTALGSSLMRAVHTRLDRPPLIDDPWGDRLVLESERQAVAKLILRGLDPATRAQIDTLDSVVALDAALRAHLGYGWAIVRTRYAEDALEAAVAGGVRQYVILGAGFDSFALRQPTFAREVAIFEVDHPTTQNLKQQRLRDCGVPLPRNLHFVPADLGQEKPGTALARSSFSPTEPAFFSWLGVSGEGGSRLRYGGLQCAQITNSRCTASRCENEAVQFDYLTQGEKAHQARRRYNSSNLRTTSAAAFWKSSSGAVRMSATTARASSSGDSPSLSASCRRRSAWAAESSMLSFMGALYRGGAPSNKPLERPGTNRRADVVTASAGRSAPSR
jgi:methyltransferase (TIGR00027 family)